MTDSTTTTSSPPISGAARPYRSKKQRPCDGCRRRRIGCFVPTGQQNCTLCHHRGISCTFELAAPVKKGRVRSARRALPTEETRPNADLTSTFSAPTPPPRAPVSMRDDNDPSCDTADPVPYDGTEVAGRSSLYVGTSSDQDVYLLRHLPFDERASFGHRNWRVWKILADEKTPAYFTSYPNTLLDVDSGLYDLEAVDALVSPHQSQLLTLYYAYIHPSLPILGSRPHLEAAIASRTVPTSLAAAVYCSAMEFAKETPVLQEMAEKAIQPLRDIAFARMILETRTPSLQTIQAMLLYMQLPPLRVREPNHPGFWTLTSQLVGLAQETGLHVDPTEWNICSVERRKRRVLWWAVYMHDKWLAHWLGRPSHIDDRQFSVSPLGIEDFSELLSPPVDERLSHLVTSFVMLSRLTICLSSVLDNFYTIRHGPSDMPPEEALSRASICQQQLKGCLEQQGSVLLRPSRCINADQHAVKDYAFVFAYYGIAVSIQRALFACVGGTSYYDVGKETFLFEDLFQVFEDLLQYQNIDGLWLSYTKSNIAIIGNFIITALLSSTDDGIYQTRQGTLDRFRQFLETLANRYEFAALPLLRLNLLLERFNESSGPDKDELPEM